MAEHRVLLNLSENFAQHDPYFQALFEKYATRALGLQPPLCPMILIAHLGVISQSGVRTTQRLRVEQITIVPLSILPRSTALSYGFLLNVASMQKAANATVLPLMFSPCIEVDLGPNEPADSFSATTMLTFTPGNSGAGELYSRSFGVMRALALDLDVLYWYEVSTLLWSPTPN